MAQRKTYELDPLKTFSPTAFTGRYVVISGAGSGIGRVTAVAFGKLGATVLLTGRREAPLQETAQLVKAAGGAAHLKTCDIRDPMDIESLVEWAEKIGPVDTLVNNAGANFMSPAISISPNGFQTVVRTVLLGTWNMTRAFGAKMIERKFGRIISVAATNARDGSPMMIHSGAAKAGVISMMETAASEWGPFGVTANSVSPGPVDSAEANEILWPDPKVYDAVAKRTPLGGRMAWPDDVALTVVFLATDAACFITGTDVVVDGGHRLHVFYPGMWE